MHHDDAVAPGKQLAGHHRTDVAGTAGDKDRAHEIIPSPIATGANPRGRILAGGLRCYGDGRLVIPVAWRG